ncbi:MAG: transcription antitermination factor NusB [Verrucomicrobia bacterium]|nr:transcription antitermination factor NusB [Verrucomicrobiota bacterium]
MANSRRRGREAALQLLFASDLENQLADGQNREAFWELCTANPKGRKFAEDLVDGVLRHLLLIDQALAACLENFEVNRLAAVDRNLLRLATFELLFVPDVPPPVVINEAIEIAKAFGTPDSGRFVNGVLDQIRKNGMPPSPAHSTDR